MAEEEIIYDTFYNQPPPNEYYDEWPEDEYPVCIVCGAPYGSCMDIIFDYFGEPNAGNTNPTT